LFVTGARAPEAHAVRVSLAPTMGGAQGVVSGSF